METAFLITQDRGLAKELSDNMPKGIRISRDIPSGEGAFLFFDIDSMRPGKIRDFALTHYVIAITKQKKTDLVMEAATFGAYEIIQRPFTSGAITDIIKELQDFRSEIEDNIPLAPLPPTPTCAIVGHSPIIMDVCKKLARLSQVDAPVLITGETGTGKELIAESIAQLSSRFGKPFVVVNCAAMPETLIESELFGFERGSFTGAVSSKEGILKIADEGSVFFDEVGELPLPLQAKLLRFLQTQTFYPLGSTREVQVNVRLLSATNRNLESMVRQGTFREDLYHRLRVTTIHIPPLRERKKDLIPLIQCFLNRYKHTAQRQIRGFTRQLSRKLSAHDWPGNIRELENTIRSALALARTPYLTTHELGELRGQAVSRQTEDESLGTAVVSYVRQAMDNSEPGMYDKLHREVDRTLLSYVMTHLHDNQSEAARLLGISRLTLRKKLNL